MRINLSKEDLFYGLSAVGKAVSSKSSLPILSGIMIKAEAGKVIFRATDLEMAIECVVSADVPEQGEVVVPGRYFTELVKCLPSCTVGLESVDNLNLSVYYGQSQLTVCCFDAAEFPALPKGEGALRREMPAPVFRKLVRQTAIAASNEEIRPVFTGILFDISEEKLKMIATDTHRMAVSEFDCPGSGSTKVIVPCRNMQEFARLAVNDDEPVILMADKSQVYFYTANITFISRVISGQYPDYKSVIPAPSAFNSQAVLDRSVFSESIERASLISRDQSKVKGNTVRLQWKQGIVFISADVPDVGKIHEELPVSLEGSEMTCNYNGRYISDVLRVIDEEKIFFRMTGPVTPAVIVPEQDASYLYLILPIRMAN